MSVCVRRICYVSSYVVIFFFFKQKTAYEQRISDWRSDVCSSDLLRATLMLWHGVARVLMKIPSDTAIHSMSSSVHRDNRTVFQSGLEREIGRASGRARECQYV